MKQVFALFLILLFLLVPTVTFGAPSPTNRIGLRVARVYLAKEDAFDITSEAGTNIYEYFTQPLKLDDQIRYAWFGTNLSLSNVSAPVLGNGYLKVYKNDDSIETNFIKNVGTSPLPLRELAEKLTPGRNTLLLVLVENANGTSDPATKVQISFDFAPDVLPPSIEVIAPAEKSVFSAGINRDFNLKLNNFYLEKTNTNVPNKGMLEVYANEVTPATLLFTTTSSTNRDTFSEVSFTTSDIEKIQDIGDNKNAQLIFVVKTSAGKEIESARKSLPVVLNYGGTLDLGLPSIAITSPKNNAEITNKTTITLSVKNFELLSGVDINSQKANAGYIQIRINDILKVNNTNKTEFTLADFGIETVPGVITIRVDLVNQQFALLQPSAQSSVSVAIQKAAQGETTNPVVTSSTWRYVILIATIILILGSIAVLIVKG